MNKIFISLACLLLIAACSSKKTATTTEINSAEEIVFESDSTSDSIAEEFTAKDRQMIHGQLQDIKYPPAALQNEVVGTVLLKFRIIKGEVDDISVISEKLGFGLEEEAIRVLKMTNGKWESDLGNPNVYYILPIKFELY